MYTPMKRICPFCGGEEPEVEGDGSIFYVMCNVCGAVGPACGDEQTALDRWNTRYMAVRPPYEAGGKPEVVRSTLTSSEPTLTNPDALLDPVNRPAHYEGDGEVPCMRAMRSMMHEADVAPIQAYWWGGAFKYIWRIFSKENPGQDIEKAIRCLTYLRDEVGYQVEED